MSSIDDVAGQARRIEQETEALREQVRANARAREQTERAARDAQRNFEQRDRQLRRELADLENQNARLGENLAATNDQLRKQQRDLERQQAETTRQLEETRRLFLAEQQRLRTQLEEMDRRHAAAIAELQRRIEEEAERQRRLAAQRMDRATALCLLAERAVLPWLDTLEALDLTSSRSRVRRQIAAARQLTTGADAEAALGIAVMALDSAQALGGESMARQAQLSAWQSQLEFLSGQTREHLRNIAIHRYDPQLGESAHRAVDRLVDRIRPTLAEYLLAPAAFYHLRSALESAEQEAAILSARATEAAQWDEARRQRLREVCGEMEHLFSTEHHERQIGLARSDSRRSDLLVSFVLARQTLRLRLPLEGGVLIEDSGAQSIAKTAQTRLQENLGSTTVRLLPLGPTAR